MAQWFQDGWQEALRGQGILHFDQFWRLEGDLVESPNEDRGGVSGVIATELKSPEGSEVKVFVKRQRDHLTRAVLPFLRRPTASREFDNLQALANLGFSVPKVVYFAEEKGEDGWRAVLVTQDLSGQIPLSDLEDQWWGPGGIGSQSRRETIRNAATVVKSIHSAGYRHGSLYPKHLFCRLSSPENPISLIDLEKMRQAFCRGRARLFDLDALNRRTPWVSRSERLLFLRSYLAGKGREKELWRALSRRFDRKMGRKP